TATHLGLKSLANSSMAHRSRQSTFFLTTHCNTLRFKVFGKQFHGTQTKTINFFLNNTPFGPRFAAG
ncbi:MAG TPA: hypothetical protein PKZ69_07780, partial [Candidatus Cloacimonadota bacterium]|nr:hypothetical protein [Candidatus Cloacimonadota bacterium]